MYQIFQSTNVLNFNSLMEESLIRFNSEFGSHEIKKIKSHDGDKIFEIRTFNPSELIPENLKPVIKSDIKVLFIDFNLIYLILISTYSYSLGEFIAKIFSVYFFSTEKQLERFIFEANQIQRIFNRSKQILKLSYLSEDEDDYIDEIEVEGFNLKDMIEEVRIGKITSFSNVIKFKSEIYYCDISKEGQLLISPKKDDYTLFPFIKDLLEK